MATSSLQVGFSRKQQTYPSRSLVDDDYTIWLIGNPSSNAIVRQKITCDGSSKILFDGPKFEFVKDDSTKLEKREDVTAGTYELIMKCIDNDRIEVTLQSIVTNASVAPKLTGMTINGSNNSIVVSFNEECYAAAGKTGNLVAADFVATLTGGVATTPVISSPVHTAGGKSITFTLAYTGNPNGLELLKIVPASNQVFNRGGVVMPTTELAQVYLNDI